MTVLALCAPSFGAILVYKQSSSLKGFEFNWDVYTKGIDVQISDPCDANQTPPLYVNTTTLTSAQDTSAKLESYVVMDVDVNTLVINDEYPVDNNSLEVNNVAAEADGAAMIIVDKKAKTYTVIRLTGRLAPADENDFVADANYGYVEADGIFKAVAVLKKDKATKKTLAVLEMTGHLNSSKQTDLSDHNDPNHDITSTSDKYKDQEFGLETMTGALKKADIDGSKEKVLIPTSLKGHGWKEISDGTRIWGNIQWRDTNQASENFQDDKTYVQTNSNVYTETGLNGTATLKLDKKATQAANKATTPTTKGTVAALIAALGSDYEEADPPPAYPYIDD
jgi:hypothetical protein